jgi:hypothetical protein
MSKTQFKVDFKLMSLIINDQLAIKNLKETR